MNSLKNLFDGIRLIVLDLDGTLIDSRHDIAASMNYALAQFRLEPLSVEEVTRGIGTGTRGLVERCLGNRQGLFEECYRHFSHHYRKHLLDSTQFYPGVEEILHQDHDYDLAILSNKSEEFCIKIMEGLRSAHHYRMILGGDSTEEKKPHPSSLQKILHELDYSPKETIMIGDSRVDVEVGRNVGARTLAAVYGFNEREYVLASNPDGYLEGIQDLSFLLDH